MGRARTVERRKEREQQKKRQRQTTILIGVGVVAVLAILLVVLINGPAEAPIPSDSVARYQDIPQSKSPEGFPILGNTNAPVKVIEYSSFDCPHCQEFHANAIPSIVDRARNGEIQLTYVPVYGTGGIANGQGAAQAAICAGEQGKFWEFHDALFTWQAAYANTAFSNNRLGAGISNLGIDKARWDSCMASDLPNNVISAAVDAGRVQNIPGTPTILVNGTVVASADLASVNTAIDQALAQAGPLAVPTVETTLQATAAAAATVEATAEATIAASAETTAEATTTP
jgi:protein-disulfide isomerase